MAEAFDPYVKWLAIRDPARPPHHYRLLGLDLFESDPYVIACAADRQTAHVSKFLTGRHPRLCRQLLRELIRARRCLLSPEEKRAYDARLRQKLDKQAAVNGQAVANGQSVANGRPVPPPPTEFRAAEPPRTTSKQEPAAHEAAPVADDSTPIAREPAPSVDVWAVRSMARQMVRSQTRRQRHRRASVLAAAFCLVVLFVLAALATGRFELPPILATDRSTDGADRALPAETAVSERMMPVNRQSATAPPTDDPSLANRDEPSNQPADEESVVDTEERITGSDDHSEGQVDTAEAVGRIAADEDASPVRVEATAETAVGTASKAADIKSVVPKATKTGKRPVRTAKQTKGVTSKSPRRRPLPDKTAQQQALVRIKSVYAEQFDKVDSDQRREDLARFLLQKAVETKDDDAARLVMLCQAQHVARDAGKWPLVVQAVDLRARWFEVDALAERAELFEQICRLGGEEDVLQICEPLDSLFQKAVARDRFGLAKRCAKTKVKAVRRVGDAAAVRRADERLRAELPEYVARKKSAESAEKLLRDNPADAVSHRLVGEYQCYNRGRWSEGLAHLESGDNEDLKQIAARELARPTEAAQRKEVADGWWTLSEARNGSEKTAMRQRAGYWLRKALPGLTGLARDDAVQKLAELDAVSRPAGLPKKELSPQRWVDVLPQIDLAAHTVSAGWQKEGNRLRVLKAGKRSRLMLPVAPSSSYELQVEFASPFDSGETLALWLPTGSTACVLYIGPGHSGIGSIDGRPAQDNETTLRYASFPPSESYKLVVGVTTKGKNVRIESLLNDEPFLAWQGAQSSLSGESDWQFPSRQNVGLGSWSGDVVVRMLRLRQVE